MKHKTLSFLFTALIIFPLYGQQYEIRDINLNVYGKYYNSLSSVEENDANIKNASQFSSFLKDAEKIVVNYELETHVGLRLIHRHFLAGSNELMVEEYQSIENIPSLITSALDIGSAIEKKASPSSWIFSDEGTTVFETSTDSAVKIGINLLQKEPEFMDEMSALIKKNKLNNLLSVALLKRDSLQPKEQEMYLEVNNTIVNKSTVQLWPREQKPLDTIITTWGFNGPKQMGCLKIWGCVPVGQGGHIHAENYF